MVGLRADYRLSRRVQLFGRIDNALNAHYATFGVLGDPTGVNAPGVPASGSVDPRFQSPTPPLAALGGVRMSF